MDSTVLVGLIAGIFGAIAAGVPAYFAQRNSPSRKVSDTAVIVDSTGKVVTMYRAEIERLDKELSETREEIRQLQLELAQRPTKAELLETVEELNGHIVKLKARVETLQAQVKTLGGTPHNGP